MSHIKNVSIGAGNKAIISGSTVEVTGSLYGSAMSGTTAQFTSLSASSVRINNAYTLPTSDGTTGQVISTNGSGQLTFSSVSAGSSPGGPDTSVQFNKSSTLSGSSNLTYDYNTGVLSGTLSSFTQVSASYIDLGYPSEIAEHQQGRLYYDDSNNKLKVQTEISSSAEGITEIALGQQLAVRVKNISGVSLAKGKIVHISGSTNSDTPLITTASYESDSVSADTLGVLMSTVAANDTGYALLYGVLTGIDLSSYSVGDMLYLSSSGDFTTTVPQSPLHEVRIGQVTRAGPSANGAMFVRIQNGYETDELHDVLFSNKAEGDLISWDATTGVWRNKKQLTGSYEITGDITASNAEFTNITADKITAREYHTELVSASIIYQSGSTKFGNTPGGAQQDIHEFSGSLYITGSTVTLTGGSFSGNGSNLTNLSADNISAGTLAVARGGTGQTTYTNGQLLIGNTTGGTLAKSTLTEGTGISITNGAGSITIAATNNGTVTDVSVASSNGFAGSVATSTTTPVITLSTTVTGILKGNGTSISAATSGTDYAPATSGTSILYGDGAGGFSSVTIGTGLSFVAGTLSSSQIGLTDGDKGDITVASSGATWTIDNDVVSDAKLRNSVSTSVIGRSAGTTGDPADIQATADNQVLRRSGGTLGFGTLANASLANSSVTIGSTSVSLGSTATTLAGLASVTSTGFTGSLNGNADTATSATTATNVALTATNTTNSSHFVTFVDTAIGNENVRTDTDLTYNPFSNTLTVGTLVETSTREIKENIKSIPNQLSKIKKLNPVKYNKIDSKRKEIGLIAEEVQEVYPEFVHEKGINYPKMVSVLISAVQELTSKVEKQQREITSLKKNLKR